ncbi:MAG: cyanophycin synthetase, partial [Roseateles sp.]
MDVSRTRALRGPNMWSRHTAIEAVVHCSETERSLERLPGFEARLRQRFPTIGELRADASLAQVLEQATLALQAQAGCPVTFSQTHVTPETGTYQIVIEYSEEDVGRLAFEQAVKLIQAALDDAEFDADSVIAALRELDEDIRLGPSTGSIVNAAVARGIPFRRLTQGSLVQF